MSYKFLLGVIVGVLLPPVILAIAFAWFAIVTSWRKWRKP